MHERLIRIAHHDPVCSGRGRRSCALRVRAAAAAAPARCFPALGRREPRPSWPHRASCRRQDPAHRHYRSRKSKLQQSLLRFPGRTPRSSATTSKETRSSFTGRARDDLGYRSRASAPSSPPATEPGAIPARTARWTASTTSSRVAEPLPDNSNPPTATSRTTRRSRFLPGKQYVLADEMYASNVDASSFISHQYIIAGQASSR